ncbi:Hypoxia induced protein conserved region [Enhydrobacter aerosaccus]|uniref:Hypoxia induced protein conserved region n=1 Tax=Enhydrobacter aerosaccus TaxID=225324 RepID=A0A1T4JWG6_9HYPH|nr:HIG1 domain-containing protein [Enhydrobacter aerosaccus]SJZ34516.1 Hypoxia induced protein conserved region [Enhydrobacter aerosaccus]
MKLASILFVLVMISGLATLGILFAGLVSMARGPTDSIERARSSNKLMWWRVRLQLLTIGLILLWYLASRA